MYCDPFAGDYPIPDDELNLKFPYDPTHNYWADVDALQPKWVVPSARFLDSKSSAAFSDSSGPRESRVREIGANGRPQIRIKGMAFKRYVRAVDPAGNVTSLITSTTRADALKPDGDDGLETATRVIGQKSRKGWLVLENDPSAWSPYARKTGNEYAAWALAVAKLRREKHAEFEHAEQTLWLEEKLKEGRANAAEQGRIQGEVMAEAMSKMGGAIAAEVAKAVRKEKDGGKQPTV